jgi:microsomal dipeptidase-like Zn-dependent dipeptidase
MPGFADLHAHWMAHLAYGGHLLWGEPAGDPATALRPCDGRNHGGTFDILGVDISKKVIEAISQHEYHDTGLDAVVDPHLRNGYPRFDGWPFWGTMCHQQMHIDWVRRAYEGGLRLMSVLVLNNRFLSWVMEARREAWDDEQIRAQIAAVRALAARPENRSWLEIADSSEHAAHIIAADKLALVLGVEVDQVELLISRDPHVLRELEAEADDYLSGRTASAPRIDSLASTLHGLGIRQITPIHLANNVFGGAALYMNLTATNSHWLQLWWNDEAYSDTSGWPDVAPDPSDDVEFKLEAFQVPTNRKTFFLDGPIDDAVRIPAYADASTPAHANALGLTKAGHVFLLALWRHGILVDIDHMSARAVSAVLPLAERYGVPLLATHCSLRARTPPRRDFPLVPDEWWTAWDGRHPTRQASPYDWPTLRHEGMRTDAELRRIYALGGIVGVAARQPTTTSNGRAWFGRTPPARFDAGTIPAGWAQYLHVTEVTGWEAAVALGTDANGMNQAPRPLPPPLGSVPTSAEDVYRPRQPNGIERLTTGERAWDVGLDGLAHYGLLPDLLQRWRAEGIGTNELAPLMRSADGYVATMRAAERASTHIFR